MTSCRPGLVPTTKSYVVRRLDSVEQEIILLKKAVGADCLARVCKSLGILEREYFGLRFVDKSGEHHWINLRNPLHEQVHNGNRPIMEMRVKYFIKPQKILQPITRLHFYKQLKKDLLLGRLKVTSSTRAARLSALIAQIDRGDYKQGTQYHQKIFCATESDNMDARIQSEHSKLIGTSAEIAIEKFLVEVASLELYGVELFPVEDGSDRLQKVIGVGPDSIHLYSPTMQLLKRYSYSAIQYTAFHGRKFTALMTTSSEGGNEQVEFELKSKTSAQALYRSITEFHTFFRREKVNRMVKTAGYCKSLIGNFKGQNPDRFYFDVTRTHREVVDHVWSILHPSSDNAPVHSSASPSPTEDRPINSSSQAPPLPPPMRGMQRSQSTTHSDMGSNSYRLYHRHRMPPLPPYSQRSYSTDVIGVNSRRRTPHSFRTSYTAYTSPSISETGSDSDDHSVYTNGGSDTYTTTSEPTYFQSTGSDPGTTYITSGDSECSAASLDIRRINSPPPVYTEVDPEHEAPLNFTNTPNSGLMLVSPIISVPARDEDTSFNFDAASVLARTRELEGELQRLRTAMTCRLCKQNPIGATFCPCGHTVCCYSCAQSLGTCWECDEVVHSVQKMLLAH